MFKVEKAASIVAHKCDPSTWEADAEGSGNERHIATQ